MICNNCGSQVPENMKFCGKCGTRISENAPDNSMVLLNRVPAAEKPDNSTVLLNRVPAAEKPDNSTVLLNRAPAAEKPDNSTVLLNRAPAAEKPDNSTVLLNHAPDAEKSDSGTVLLNNDNSQTVPNDTGRSKEKKPKKKSHAAFVAAIVITVVLGLGAGVYYLKQTETADDILIKAEQNINNENFDAALADYDRLLAKDPLNVSAYKGKANVYIKQERFDEAEDVLRTGFSRTNDSGLWEMFQELQNRNIGE